MLLTYTTANIKRKINIESEIYNIFKTLNELMIFNERNEEYINLCHFFYEAASMVIMVLKHFCHSSVI